MDIAIALKRQHGLTPNMHLTCTNMEKQKVIDALTSCKEAGITNIVALRGDPPAGQEAWAAVEGGFNCALDLVKFIRAEHGDFFHLSVAGYPEGHPNSISVLEDTSGLSESELARCARFVNVDGKEELYVCKDADFEKEMEYLKQKIDAGGDCIITQLFFDTDVFTTFVEKCRAAGITVPIIPGIMCCSSKGGFGRMTKFCKTRVPADLQQQVDNVVEDADMKAVGISYGTALCKKLLDTGTPGLHFYTLNAGAVTDAVMANLTAMGYNLTNKVANGTASSAATADTNIGGEQVETVFEATMAKASV